MIRKRKNKRANGKTTTFYQAVVYFKGEVVSRKSFDTKAQAVKYEEEVLRKCKLGKQGLNEGYTFGMCLEDYFNSDFKQLDQSTQRSRTSTLNLFRIAPIYKNLMTEFTDITIDDFIEWLLKQPTASISKRKSFLNELVILGVVLNWYREYKDSAFAPPILKRHRKKCKYKIVEERVPNYYMEPKKVLEWLDYIKTNNQDPVYYRIALFMVLTGCRVGEAVGLCWDKVYLSVDKPFVQIMRIRNWKARRGEPRLKMGVKTKTSRRTINLPPVVVDEFRKIRKLELDGYRPVFYTYRGNLPVITTINKVFSRAFEALKMPWTGTHIARHTAGTLALIAGRDLAEVQAMLGHVNVTQTLQYAKIIALQNNSAPHQTAKLLGL